MKATVILKDKTDYFYHGGRGYHGEPDFIGLLNMPARDQLDYLRKQDLLRDKIKIGNGSFRDQVEFNQEYRAGKHMVSKIEPRKGYMLLTFEI